MLIFSALLRCFSTHFLLLIRIKNHITPAFGAVELQAVKGTHIQRLYNSMIAAGRSGKTVKNVSAVLHKAFSAAVKQGIISANPCDAAELPKVERKELHPLADEAGRHYAIFTFYRKFKAIAARRHRPAGRQAP